VTAQKQFGENWSATASYFGNKTTHMWIGMEINPAVYSATATTGNTNQRRVLSLQNPTEGQYFASVTQLNMDGEGHYNGGLFSLQKRFSNSYSLSGSYTLSRCINDQDPQQFLSSVFSHPGDIKADRVLRGRPAPRPERDGGRQHTHVRFTRPPRDRRRVAMVHHLPGVLGCPMNVTIGRDNALTAAPNQRPDLVGDWKLANPTASAWFNTAAFALPAPGTYGNLKRNALRGPGTWNVDTALTRKFAAGQGQQIEVRAEAFNLFNLVRAGVAGTTVARRSQYDTFTNSTVRQGHDCRGSTDSAVRRQIRVLDAKGQMEMTITRMRLVHLCLFALIAIGMTTTTFAHHSQSQFEPETSISITGSLTRISWSNPHTLFLLDAKRSTRLTTRCRSGRSRGQARNSCKGGVGSALRRRRATRSPSSVARGVTEVGAAARGRDVPGRQNHFLQSGVAA
jgi:hypothetical protein